MSGSLWMPQKNSWWQVSQTPYPAVISPTLFHSSAVILSLPGVIGSMS